jgi:Mor family transcriptional regulator
MKALLAQRHQKRAADLDVSDLVLASVVSKLAASTATYPHEVVRARMHVKGLGPFKGTFDVIRELWAEGGAKSFYRGCGTNLVCAPRLKLPSGDSSVASRVSSSAACWSAKSRT